MPAAAAYGHSSTHFTSSRANEMVFRNCVTLTF